MSNARRETLMPYYVPEQSRLPILATIGLFAAIFGAGMVLNGIQAGAQTFGPWLMIAGMALFSWVLFRWFAAAIGENLLGRHSLVMRDSYAQGMIWFIFSEVFFFFGFFFTLFYVRFFVGPWLGDADTHTNTVLWPGYEFQWPPLQTPQEAVGGVSAQYPASSGEFAAPERSMAFPGWRGLTAWLPLWNTVALLSSSFTVHLAHLGLKANRRGQLHFWLGVTILLGFIFIYLQYQEYHEAYVEYGLTLRSGAYGATFFLLTGFHGFHVCLGAFILLVIWLRAVGSKHFSPDDHFGFEAASWYWHFVDVVWVCLFLFVYIM